MSDNALSDAWLALARTVPNHVRQAAFESLASATQDPNFVNTNAADICQVLLQTLGTHINPASRRALQTTLRHCLKSDDFLKSLTAGLVRLESKPLVPSTAVALLQWSGLVLQELDAVTSKKAIMKLIECQASWFDFLAASGQRFSGAAQRAIGAAIRQQPALFDDYVAVAGSKGSASLCQALWVYAQKKPDLALTASQSLLQIFVDKVLSAKERPPHYVLTCFSSLLKAASSDQIGTMLVPAAVRMIRRSPEAALPTVTFMLDTLQQGMSGQTEEILPVLLQQARHAKEAVRGLAVEAIAAFAVHIKDPSALQSCVEDVQRVLDGTEHGKLKSAQERTSMASALQALAVAPGRGGGIAAVATSACDFLCAFYQGEVVEEVKIAVIKAVTEWVPRCERIPPSVVTRMEDGLKQKETIRRAHLRVLTQILSANTQERGGQLAQLAPALAKIVQEGTTKVAVRVDGILALLVAALIASADAGADSVLEKEGVWKLAAAEDCCPLLSAATAAALAPEDAARQAQLIGALLTLHANHLGGEDSPAVATASKTLVLLLLHHAPAVRSAAGNAAREVAAASNQLCSLLLDSLQHWASSPSEVTVINVSSAEGEPPMSLDAVHERYLHALLACLPPKQSTSLSPNILAMVLLLSHHPMIGSARRTGSAWGAVSHKISSVHDALVAGAAQIVAHLVAGPTGVGSKDVRERAAACGALRCAASIASENLFAPVMEALAPLLDRTAHDALAAKQLRVYATPRGRASNENEDGSMIPAELFEDMMSDKSAITPPIFPPSVNVPDAHTSSAAGAPLAASNGPSRPSARPSAPKPSKPGKPPAKDPAVEARERQLKAEAEVRAEVIRIRETLAHGLDALGAFALGDCSFTVDHLNEISEPVVPLLTSPLVGPYAALDCMNCLAGCLPGLLGFRALDIGTALRLVAIADADPAQDGAYQRLAAVPCMESAVHAMLSATGGRPASEEQDAMHGTQRLPGPVYSFCFPILRAVLRCPLPTSLHDAALNVVALHLGPDSDVPKPQAFALLYHVLDILPAFRDKVQGLLRTLCSGIAIDDTAALKSALQGVCMEQAAARRVALTALDECPALATGASPTDVGVVSLLSMACYDPSEENAQLAHALWSNSQCALPKGYIASLVERLASAHADVRTAAAAALAAGVEAQRDAPEAMAAVVELYHSGAGRSSRLGSAAALCALAPHLASSELTSALTFLLSAGLVDDDDSVRSEMMNAGSAVVDAAGRAHAETLLPLFESYLEGKAGGGGLTEEQYDHVRQGAVVFMGTLARHMDATNPKVKSIVDTLVEVLTTPSESVQRSVSDRLPPLMQALNSDTAFVESVVKRLLDRALHGKSYGDRRGAAYGLAGAVKGLGLSSLKGMGIMDALKTGVEDKNDVNAREGALLSYECLSDKLGRMFEPYVITILPMLLTAFGDTSAEVREAANGASRVIMGQLSAQGVKLVLPHVLTGVEAVAWRTKQGSIQLLGAMAYCAPKQLSTCLPTIVPRLGEVLADPHPKVSAAAKEALNEVGSVIRNPEVSRLVPLLLSAVADPAKNNKAALGTLLRTVFVNTIDAASLALIAPVVHRGLRDRSGDVKKRAARIVGNLCALINDPKDMAPYVPLLLPELQNALSDPLPEVRATSARALGALTVGMGAAHIGDMTPWLLEKMLADSSPVERSGAAQGLAEVLAVQGAASLEQVLPEVLAGCHSRSAGAREGSLTLFKYLPHCMPEVFRPHLPDILPAVLGGLADEAEGVRDAALSAGRVAVELYSTSALPQLLPAVEAGAGNANWRIRQSSIELLGDLLFKVAGTSGRIQQNVHDEESEGISVEAHGKAIIDALGMEKRNEVLARLYMARSDMAYTVRSAALHVWKTIVTNTPKTLGEILPALMTQVISNLAMGEGDRSGMAGLCLGELVRKMGERVLSQILPILKTGMVSEDAPTRAGVCNGLREVLENASRHQLAEHLGDLLPAVQNSLCDADPDVRAAAGQVMNELFKGGGGAATDSVIPSLLAGLEGDEESSSKALEGLRVVLSVRPQLLAAMAPRLTKPPFTSTNLRALGALAEVAGPSIHSHLPTIVPPMLTIASSHQDASPAAAAAHASLVSVATAVQEDGLHIFITELHRGLDDPARRRGAASAIVAFCKNTRLDYQEHVPLLLSSLIALFTEEDQDTLAVLWEAVSAVASSIPKEVAPSFVRTLKDAVMLARERQRRKKIKGELLVPGFCLPKALSPVLPIYLQGVLQGSSPELRELAAEGLGELVEVTGEDSLKPFVVQITGPLIRIIGDRFPWQTKAAILKTMGLLVTRAGAGLRPFIPQLQTTFVKCLADPAQGVRQRAAMNLGELTRMALRLDQLVSDLAASARTAEPAVQEAYLTAIQGALIASGDKLSGETLDKVGSAVQDVISGAGEDETVLRAAAGALGAYSARCTLPELQSMLENGALAPPRTGSWSERLSAALVVAAVAEHSANRLEEAGVLAAFVNTIIRLAKDENVDVKQAISKAVGRLVASELRSSAGNTSKSLPALVMVLVALLGRDQHGEVQRQTLATLRHICTAKADALEPHYTDIVPSIISVIQDSSGTTKLAAERTLAKVLQLDGGSTEAVHTYLGTGKAGSLAKQTLNETYVRRLSRLPVPEEDDLASYVL